MTASMSLERIVYSLGCLTLAFLSINVLRFVLIYLRSTNLSRYKRGSDSWAIVTGGGGGIGYGFALELSRQGFNLILIGHLESELKDAKARLERAKPSVQVRYLVLDAANASFASIDSAISTLAHLNITILVNNVGGDGQAHAERMKPYARCTPDEIDNVINLNNRFMVYLTRILLPALSQKKQPTLILSLSSASIIGIPYVTIYSATKSFVATFSRSLAIEVRAENPKSQVQVTAIIPGDVQSKTHTVPTAWAIPTADEYARIVFAKVPGCGDSVCVPYWRHALMIKVVEWLPSQVIEMGTIERMRKLKIFFTEQQREQQKKA